MLFKSPRNSFAYLCKPSLVFGLSHQVMLFRSSVKFFAPPTSPSAMHGHDSEGILVLLLAIIGNKIENLLRTLAFESLKRPFFFKW